MIKTSRKIAMLCAAGAAALTAASPAAAVSFGYALECPYDCGVYSYGDSTNGYVGGTVVAESFAGQAAHGGGTVQEGRAARADYGKLGVAVASAVTNNGNGSPIVFAGMLSKSFWNDTFLVSSGSLAPGTEVLLTLTSLVHVAAHAPPQGYPGAPLFPDLPTGLTYAGPNTLANDLNFGIAVDGWDATGRDYANVAMGDFSDGLTGTHTFSFSKLAHVGDLVTANVRFEAVTLQYNPVTYSNGFAGAAMHGLGTATTYLNFGGQDIAMTALSGHDYEIFSAVPEPGQWAMLIFGFGAAGVVLRAHRRRGAAHTLG